LGVILSIILSAFTEILLLKGIDTCSWGFKNKYLKLFGTFGVFIESNSLNVHAGFVVLD